MVSEFKAKFLVCCLLLLIEYAHDSCPVPHPGVQESKKLGCVHRKMETKNATCSAVIPEISRFWSSQGPVRKCNADVLKKGKLWLDPLVCAVTVDTVWNFSLS